MSHKAVRFHFFVWTTVIWKRKVTVAVVAVEVVLVPVVALSKTRVDLDTGIMGLNPAEGMDICPHFSVLRSPVEV
jgi:hypothetical protein